MDLEQTVQELRTRIARLRAQLELNNTSNDKPTTSVREEPKPSAADAYKAKLMGKKPS